MRNPAMASRNTPVGGYKGRGATANPEGRFQSTHSEPVFEDGLDADLERAPQTSLTAERARSIITRNRSPDVPFEQSINPYRGCEHGCVYCFARPSHSYLDLSPGLDFETKIFYKLNAAELLEAELRRTGYEPSPIAIGANTDPYQPAERELGITRSLLEVLDRYNHPVALITKSALVERDIDILGSMAERGLARVTVSVTMLDDGLKRVLEPRTASPARRLRTIERLAAAGIGVGVLAAPMIPAINDQELESILERAAAAGATNAGYVLLRLPHELKDLFRDWLDTHHPQRADHVMSLVRQSRGGKDYDSGFGTRMRGTGQFAELLAQRFRVAARRHGLNQHDTGSLDCSQFRVPVQSGDQMALWD